jgi:hypothetical protein
VNGSDDSGERQEVLLQMKRNGIEKVRGWKYVNEDITNVQVKDIHSNWVEMFNLCRICMGEGHMASTCTRRRQRGQESR